MQQKKEFDKYDVLADVVRALRDDTQEVLIETIGVKKTGYNSVTRQDAPQTPTKKEKFFMGAASLNRMYAESIKIGKDISIKRVHRKPTPVKGDKNEYMVSNGSYYVVRTPHGEAMFDSNDNDFLMAWNIALQKYDGTYSYGGHNFLNEKVKKVYGGPGKLKDDDTRTNSEKATDQLKGLGVEPDILAQYIAQKKQNS